MPLENRKNLYSKNALLRTLSHIGAEVAQPGRALDPALLFVAEGEAEDRVVAGSNPALGTFVITRTLPSAHYF